MAHCCVKTCETHLTYHEVRQVYNAIAFGDFHEVLVKSSTKVDFCLRALPHHFCLAPHSSVKIPGKEE